MKRITVVLAAVLLVAGASAQGKKAPKDWAKFFRYEKENAALAASGKRVDAVFMGNSITDGWAKQDPDFFKNNNFAGRGIGGQTTSHMLVRFRRDVLDLKPKAVVIMAGINDIALNNGIIKLENALGNIESMCELAKLHKIKVILCSVTPAVQFRWRPELTPAQDVVELNKMIKRYAEQNDIFYLDYYSALVDERGGVPSKWSHDTVHPNLQCYIEVMEPLVLEAVNKVLKTKKSYISPMPQ